ncbi:MAG: ribonuclease III [Clostridia bacterium]|nr:ribonuclease III [Clostridia bacterium]
MTSSLTTSDKAPGFFGFDGDPNLVPVAKLAFLGDAVMELMVREHLVEHGEKPFRELNAQKSQLVNARAQAAAIDALLPQLSEEEFAIYRRGKNSKHKNYPKTASALDYCKATGLETLMGYLYLNGRQQRLLEIFSVIIGA